MREQITFVWVRDVTGLIGGIEYDGEEECQVVADFSGSARAATREEPAESPELRYEVTDSSGNDITHELSFKEENTVQHMCWEHYDGKVYGD